MWREWREYGKMGKMQTYSKDFNSGYV